MDLYSVINEIRKAVMLHFPNENDELNFDLDDSGVSPYKLRNVLYSFSNAILIPSQTSQPKIVERVTFSYLHRVSSRDYNTQEFLAGRQILIGILQANKYIALESIEASALTPETENPFLSVATLICSDKRLGDGW